MKIHSENSVVVFDLDDTLYYEIEYLKSAFNAIATEVCINSVDLVNNIMLKWYFSGEEVFSNLIRNYNLIKKGITIDFLIKIYREHSPDINAIEGVNDIITSLQKVGCKIGLISDGRSITQRNKLRALNLIDKFDLIIISEEFGTEKPAEINYKIFNNTFNNFKYFYYIGDSIEKDFISPNKLGWETICLIDKGENIHKQDFRKTTEYLPKHKIQNYCEIEII